MRTAFFPVLIVFLFFTVIAPGQKKQQSAAKAKQYLRDNPVWIQCIDSPHASYRYAIYAFETFWQGRPRPMGEDGEMTETYEATKDRALTPEEEKYFRYAYDYKRFLDWKHRVARMLDGAGRVYTLEQIEEHYRIRKEAEYK